VIGSIGAVGMWTVVVVLPIVQGEFAASRGGVSLAFTMTMLGFGLGGVVMGRITDRFGIVPAMASASLSSGFPTCWPDFQPRCGNSSRSIF
jgi:MFS family permease